MYVGQSRQGRMLKETIIKQILFTPVLGSNWNKNVIVRRAFQHARFTNKCWSFSSHLIGCWNPDQSKFVYKLKISRILWRQNWDFEVLTNLQFFFIIGIYFHSIMLCLNNKQYREYCDKQKVVMVTSSMLSLSLYNDSATFLWPNYPFC